MPLKHEEKAMDDNQTLEKNLLIKKETRTDTKERRKERNSEDRETV